MRGTIHECAIRIKTGRHPQLLLRHPSGCYQVLTACEEYAQAILEPWHKRHGDIIGVFNRRIPLRDIYYEAGEPVPGE